MLDQDDGQPLPAQRLDEIDADGEFRGLSPASHSSRRRSSRFEGQGARQFEPLLVDIGELARRQFRPAPQGRPVEQFGRARLRVTAPERPRPEGEAGDDVFPAAQILEDADDLEGPAMPSAAMRLAARPAIDWPLKTDLAAVGAKRAGDQVERGRLARAVRPDEAEDFARHRPSKRQIVDRDEPAECLADMAERRGRAIRPPARLLRRRLPSGARPRCAPRSRSPTMPFGRK